MDSHFNPGYMSYSHPNQHSQQQQSQQHQSQQALGSFGNLSAQNHHHESPPNTTLPPLQNQNGYPFGNTPYSQPNAQSQTPSTPHTPATASMTGSGTNSLTQMSPNNPPQPGSMLPPSSFSQPYSSITQSLPYTSSATSSMPSSTSSVGLPTIRPMPPGGVQGSMNGLPSLSAAGQPSSFMQNEEAPTHVVGSQGRRGILPSAPGRPNPPAQGTAQAQSAKSMIPQKDADGKFPCPHCTKTYLHAKHLKRHLLRHTGDRPYMCHLCKDTFSRSDILKRHFQKCSIRRGNPTGANHLAHQRRNTHGGNRLSISQQDGPIGLAGLQEVAGQYSGGVNNSPTMNGDLSGRSSRANSMMAPGSMGNRESAAGLGILGQNSAGNEQARSSGGFQQAIPAYSVPTGNGNGPISSNFAFNNNAPPVNGAVFNQQPQQMSFLGQQSSRFDHSHSNNSNQPAASNDATGNQFDWNRVFNQSGQDGFIGSQPANASSQSMTHIKSEPDVKDNFNLQPDVSDSFLGSLYSHPGAFGSEYGENEHGINGYPNWSVDDPLQAKVDSLLQYCFPNGPESMNGNDAADLVKLCLTVDNIKHFAEHYTSFNGHWPMLHMPTFKITDAHSSLVMTMICIGAVYSPRLNVAQTRQLMDFVKATVMNSSSIYSRVINRQGQDLGTNSLEVDEVTALLMVQILFTWHGDPYQRQAARDVFPMVVHVARSMGLCQPASPGHYAYSPLHGDLHDQDPQIDVETWDWHGWLEQERHNRVLYQIFLLDAAMTIYFNATPQFDPLEIHLMLPADDAAWDAKDWQECANALGLFGPHCQGKNQTGTRRSKQPGMHEALVNLLEPTASFQAGLTNCYSKFVLVHALIVRVVTCQKSALQSKVASPGMGDGKMSPRWLPNANGSSGNGPHRSAIAEEQNRLGHALDLWKRVWDCDYDLQYPPNQIQLRRFGFSRDGVHFYYLGRNLLSPSQRREYWTATADIRFKQVMTMLKRIKGLVSSDNANRARELGSVGDIDEEYGMDDLTLDMKLLFKPFDSQTDSPVASVQTH